MFLTKLTLQVCLEGPLCSSADSPWLWSLISICQRTQSAGPPLASRSLYGWVQVHTDTATDMKESGDAMGNMPSNRTLTAVRHWHEIIPQSRLPFPFYLLWRSEKTIRHYFLISGIFVVYRTHLYMVNYVSSHSWYEPDSWNPILVLLLSDLSDCKLVFHWKKPAGCHELPLLVCGLHHGNDLFLFSDHNPLLYCF